MGLDAHSGIPDAYEYMAARRMISVVSFRLGYKVVDAAAAIQDIPYIFSLPQQCWRKDFAR